MGTGTVVQMSESLAVEQEKREVASYHAWFTFVGVAVLFAANYFFRVEWVFGLSVVVVAVATVRTFAETRTAFLSLGGVGLVLLGIYTQRNDIGTITPYILALVGTGAWARGVGEAFAKGFVPPIDPSLP